MKTERIEWIDYAKFIAICLVVIGHITVFPFKIRELIFTFHMPFFFALSGIFIINSKQLTWQFVVKKIKSLIVPYFCFGVILVLAEALYGHLISHGWDDTVDYMRLKLFQLMTFDRYGKLWFLPCLFVSQIFLLLIMKVCKDKRNIVTPTVLAACGGGYF